MQLTASLTEAEITAAVRTRLAEKLPNIPDDIEVKYTAGRGDNGMSAEVKIDMGEAPLKPANNGKVTVRKHVKEEEEIAEIEKPTVEAVAEEDADTAPFNADAEVADKPRPSLFEQ